MPAFDFHPQAVTYPKGFRSAGARGGLKTSGPDVALIVADVACTPAAVFTTNVFCAAPVIVSREHINAGPVRAVVVNAGCANAVTGDEGLEDARRMAEIAAEAVGCDPCEVVVASTGVIGHRLPMDRISAGVSAAAEALSLEDDADAAKAIMTTDTRPKTAVASFEVDGVEVRIGGICKGSGMIAPNMATMLAFITTDADIDRATLQRCLSQAVSGTFNAVTVDGDTSTNDMVCLLASGLSGVTAREGTQAAGDFESALTDVCRSLAVQIAADGEGATKLVTIRVDGASSTEDANRIARTIAESPLTKTALFGCDPNWGRILAAAGRCGVRFRPEETTLTIGDLVIVRNGAPVPVEAAPARASVSGREVDVRLTVGTGPGSATVYTCDFSYDYVRINAEYHT